MVLVWCGTARSSKTWDMRLNGVLYQYKVSGQTRCRAPFVRYVIRIIKYQGHDTNKVYPCIAGAD